MESKDFVLARVVTKSIADVEQPANKQQITVRYFSVYSVLKKVI